MRALMLVLALIFAGASASMAEEELPRTTCSGVCKGVVLCVDKRSFTLRSHTRGDFTYHVRWLGGRPRNGGHFDPQMLEQIAQLQPGDPVEVAWEQGERLCAVRLTVLGNPHRGLPGAKCDQDHAALLDGPGPAVRCGTMHGTVASVDPKGRFVLQTESGEEAFMPVWKGNMPADGGGFDQAMVARIAQLKPGQRVAVTWEWDERKRCVGLRVAGD